MLRYAAIGMMGMFTSQALAQQAPGGAETPAPPASIAKPAVIMEQPLPGDFWTYEVRDEISGTVSSVRNNLVTEVTPTEITVRFSVKDKPTEGLYVYDRSWNLKSSGSWVYRPYEGIGIRTPLKVGATWRSEDDSVNSSNGSTWKSTVNSKVVGQEAVVTKAGVFETFKIETTISKRPTNDPTRKVEMTEQSWYSPAIDHWVKRTSVTRSNNHLMTNNSMELIEYGRKK